VVIPNGYDEEDFKLKDIPTEKRKIITYTGTISEAYDVDKLLEALVRLDEKLKAQLLIRFVGKIPPAVEQRFRDTGLEIELVGYVDHNKSIEYLLRSDVLLLVIPKVENNKGILTGKFFEYMASQKPILAIGPVDGDLAKIICDTNCGRLFDYSDSEGMIRFIQNIFDPEVTLVKPESTERYSRHKLTHRIAGLFDAKS
jgi:glycosyltransferase involved in cell wall biosynthesis